MDKDTILNQFEFYRNADSRFQAELEQTAFTAQLPAGAFYFHEGDACSQIALVGIGSIRVFKTGESGREITLYHVCSGETCILTASCVLAGKQYPAHAQAETETEAVIFPAVTFRQWVADKRDVQKFIFETLADRMADVMSLIEEITFNKLDKRLAVYLLQQFENNGKPVRIVHATHEKIATELGSAREVVSRLLKEFERVKAVELARSRIILRDDKRLKQMT